MIKDRNIAADAEIDPTKISGGGHTVWGDRYFVDYANGSDTMSGKTKGTAVKTLSKAHAIATTNQNDVIFIKGNTTVTETAMLTWSKNRIHVFADGGPLPLFGMGASAKVNIGVTTDTADLGLLKVTGVRNSFNGIKFSSGNTLTQAVYAVMDGGEYTRWNNCEFYKSTHLTTAGAAEFLLNGDSSQFYRCQFGDLVNGKGGSSAPRANILVSREQITGKVCRNVYMDSCFFLQKALHADANFIYGAGTTDVERLLWLVKPKFVNAILASATIADAITFGGAQTEGNVILEDPVGSNVTAFAEASQNVFVQGAVPTAATTGIAVEVAA